MTWQDYLSLALVAAAAVVVGLRAYRAMFGSLQRGCGMGCSSCPGSASKPNVMLSIGPPQGMSTRR